MITSIQMIARNTPMAAFRQSGDRKAAKPLIAGEVVSSFFGFVNNTLSFLPSVNISVIDRLFRNQKQFKSDETDYLFAL